MRRRLRKYLPIVLMALTVQILAPIATFWAAAIAVSDPLHAAFICHDNGISAQGSADNQGNQTGQPRAHLGCCSICSPKLGEYFPASAMVRASVKGATRHVSGSLQVRYGFRLR